MSGIKIGVVGAGMVGASFAYSLMQKGLASEMVLIDANHSRAVGEAMDLNHGLAFVKPVKIYAGKYADLAGADVTVITAGAAQKPGETRLQLLEKNAGILSSIIPEVVKANPEGIIVLASNPVDILTYLTHQMSGLPANKIIGSGTTLDTARLRYFLGDRYGVDPRSVHAYILGEHGDSEFAWWSGAMIAGIPLKEFVSALGVGFDQAALDQIFENTKNAAYEIIEKKMATYYAIGLGLLDLVETIVRDQHTVLPVSSMMTGQFGVKDICVSLPTIVGAKGIEKVLDIKLTSDEQALFKKSADTLKERVAEIKK
ncbi:MAG: L-lactate dehydrogenase [bacterium]|nr:L-lactate dehydrogenase [bacterium]